MKSKKNQKIKTILQLGILKKFTLLANTTIRNLDMKKYPLGEFEEIVLLTVGILYDEAYGVAIKQEMEEQLERKISVGALQSALRRMEEKGYLSSREGESTSLRGGRPKRFFTITAHGKKALVHARDIRTKLWNQIPKIALDL